MITYFMAKIIVTGGAGFIGSSLVDKLIELKHEVVIIDNLLTGNNENVNQNAKFYEEDIRDLKKLDEIFSKEKPEYVFHLAAGYLVQSIKNPQRDAEINIIGTINLIEMCVKYKIKRVIYSNSGGASYGDPEQIPITEDHPIRPLTPYGASKYAGEMYLYMYYKNHGLDYISLRYGNIYGPRQDPRLEGGVVSIFINAILKGKTPKIFGDGKQTRDYVYVGDVVDANIDAMTKGECGGYNIGTGKELSVLEILNTVKKIMGSSVSPEFKSPREGDCVRVLFDTKKINEILKWTPKTSLEKGIEKTIEWQKQQ